MTYQDKIYGTHQIEGVFEELIHTSVFQRLQRIHQGGPLFLVNELTNQTRFGHSVGVMLLIRQLGGDLKEQIAGLLHDISHTAFSHLIDHVLDNEEEDYHENIFEGVIKNQEIQNVLSKYGFEVDDFLDLEKYALLEYPLPSLSADRIDYTLRDLFQIRQIQLEEIQWFLEKLMVQENRIVVTSVEAAKWFQEKYTYLIQEYFNGEEGRKVNVIMKKLLKDCFAQKQLSEADFLKDDFFVIGKLETARAFDLRTYIQNEWKNVGDLEKVKSKPRSIDPEIFLNGKIFRLSEI